MNDDYRIYGQLSRETQALGHDIRRTIRAWYGQAVALIMHAIDSLRRTQVRLVVRLAPPDVADAVALQTRLFPEPPKDPAEAALRSSLCSLLATQANASRGGPDLQEQDWATLASVMRFLGETDREWPMRLIAPTLNRAIPKPAAPAVETASAPAYQVQSFAGLPIGNPFSALLGYVSMGLAVLVVLLGMLSWGLSSNLDKVKADNRNARETIAMQEKRNVALRDELSRRDTEIGRANQAAIDNVERASNAIRADVEQRRRAVERQRREEARRNAERAKNPSGAVGDPDEFLRNLTIQPLVPAGTLTPDANGGAADGDRAGDVSGGHTGAPNT